VHGVALALQAVDGVEVGLDPLHRLEALEQRLGLVGTLDDQVGLLLQLRQRRGDARDLHPVRHLEHVVYHVVELFGQGVDVLPVKRRDERGVEPLHDGAHQLVPPVLAGGDLLVHGGIGWIRQQVAQAARTLGHVGGRLVEQPKEGVVGRNQAKAHQVPTAR
jgi:hypothetical protein